MQRLAIGHKVLCRLRKRAFAWRIVRQKEIDELRREINSLRVLWSTATGVREDSGKTIEGVIFSKNRALQLHALLKSYWLNVSKPRPRLSVFYSATDTKHAEAYDELFENWIPKGCTVVAVRQKENCFRDQLLELLMELKSEKVFFLVDDDVFINDVDFSVLSSVDCMAYIPSLRLGTSLRWCYVKNREQPLPDFKRVDLLDMLSWDWNKGSSDWRYVFSVDGNIYIRDEVLAMAKAVSFAAPNSFESCINDNFGKWLKSKKGLCYNKSTIVNVPANRVQAEVDNRCAGISPEKLLEMWRKGYELGVSRFKGLEPVSVHQELPLRFETRR